MHSYLHGHPALTQAVRRLERLNPDQFELYFERKVATKIESKEQKVEYLSRSEDVGIAVRLIKDQRMGFSFTTSLDNDAITQAMDTAFEIAGSMPEDEDVNLFSFGSALYPSVDTYDTRGLATPVEKKIEMAKFLEAECRKQDKRITGIRSASIGETAYEVHMVDSSGEHLHHQATLYTTSITCKSEQEGEQQTGHEFGFSNFLENLNVEEVAHLAARWATELLGAKAAPTMHCPAILRNSVVAELLEFLSSSFSAEEIAKGRSMLAGKEGQRVFSEQVTLIDDGLLANGFGTSPFDGEGVPSSRISLVDGGFLSGALYDCYYAKKSGKSPTGSSSRGIKAPPSIGFSNLFMKPGKKKEQQLLDGIPKGILITDLMGVHTANPVTGDFSLGASGILIENNKLTRPVKGFAVAGNILDVFKKITDVGQDLRFFGSVGAPSIRINEISVGGT